jgi:DNA-binding MarR family transcriptional regulator
VSIEEPVASRSATQKPVSAAEAVHVAAFRSALRSFLRSSERIARASGLTPQRHLLLLMIKGAPDRSESATVTDLVERMELAQSTVTELVQRAEDVGLIRREGSESDRRVARLRLTDAGERRLASAFRAHEDERHRLVELVQELDDAPMPEAP